MLPTQKISDISRDVLITQGMIAQFRNEVKPLIVDINDKVTPKDKVFHRPLMSRDPATNTIYLYLMSKDKKQGEWIDSYYTFRIAITLLRHTGLRVNEIKDFTKDDIMQLIDNERFQVYQPKQNSYRQIILSQQAVIDLNYLKSEVEYIFLNKNTLGANSSNSNWIRFINKRLREAALFFKICLKSHSFRVNTVTSLLALAPAHKVMQIIEHSDIRSTMAYNRFVMSKDETKKLLDEIALKEKMINMPIKNYMPEMQERGSTQV